MRRSPPEHGRPLPFRAVMAASQSMSAANGVSPLVPQVMNRVVKSPRRRNVPLLMSSSVPASRG